MIPRARQGFSFKGVTAYLMHDKEALTSERVLWSETGNMYTNDIHTAAKVMAFTDCHADELKQASGGSTAGRKTETGSVYHYSLSWAIGEDPDRDHQRNAVLETLAHLGLSDHQYYMVAHDDTQHGHVHVVANLTHPETGKRAELGLDKRKLQEWALEYEREHGMHCEMRELNAHLRAKENSEHYYSDKKARYQDDQKQNAKDRLTRAYEASDNGQSFKAALELEGLTLAKGRKSYIAVDEKGDTLNLSRMIEGYRTKDIQAKLGDLDRQNLQCADELSADIKARLKQEEQGYSREDQELEQQIKLEEAAYEHGQHNAERTHDDNPYDPETILDERERLAENPLSDLQMWNATGMAARRQREGNGVLQDNTLDRGREHQELFGLQGERTNHRQKQSVSADIAAKIQQRIDERINYWREYHKVDDLEQRHHQAQQDFEKVSGFWSRLFFRGRYHAAEDHLQNREKQLRDAKDRLAADIEAINKNRHWDIDAQEKKHGIERDDNGRITGKSDQSRATVEAQEAKAEAENQPLKEAESSPEAASRLKDNVHTKAFNQKSRVINVQAKAKEQDNKILASKQSEAQQVSDTQKLHDLLAQSKAERETLAQSTIRLTDEYKSLMAENQPTERPLIQTSRGLEQGGNQQKNEME